MWLRRWDVLAPEYDMVARFNGGPNAGHTLEFDGKKFVLHVVPSGIHRPVCKSVIGNGVIIDPILIKKEIEELEKAGVGVKSNLYISDKAHIIIPTHAMLDQASELSKGDKKIGSTGRGICPTYKDKTGRDGIRMVDIFSDSFKDKYEKLKNSHIDMLSKIYNFSLDELAQKEKDFSEAIEFLKNYKVCDTVKMINDGLYSGDKILAEGAQGTLLDIEHGTYPFVTSSNVVVGGVCTGLGISPKFIRKIFGCAKAYVTRVGGGSFPTELFDEDGKVMVKRGNEYGSTTGRERRCGWQDLVILKYSCMINGVTDLVILKSDVLDTFNELKICTSYLVGGEKTDWPPLYLEEAKANYEIISGWGSDITDCRKEEDLPDLCISYLNKISEFCNIPISHVSVGPDREQTIFIERK